MDDRTGPRGQGSRLHLRWQLRRLLGADGADPRAGPVQVRVRLRGRLRHRDDVRPRRHPAIGVWTPSPAPDAWHVQGKVERVFARAACGSSRHSRLPGGRRPRRTCAAGADRADEQGPGRRRQPAGGHDHPVRRDARVLRRKEQPEPVHGDAGVLQAPHRRQGGRRNAGERELTPGGGEPDHRIPAAPETERLWARASPYAGGLRYNASTPANKRGNRVNITTPGETMRVLRSALLALALLPLVAVAQQSPTGRWTPLDDETGHDRKSVG